MNPYSIYVVSYMHIHVVFRDSYLKYFIFIRTPASFAQQMDPRKISVTQLNCRTVNIFCIRLFCWKQVILIYSNTPILHTCVVRYIFCGMTALYRTNSSFSCLRDHIILSISSGVRSCTRDWKALEMVLNRSSMSSISVFSFWNYT